MKRQQKRACPCHMRVHCPATPAGALAFSPDPQPCFLTRPLHFFLVLHALNHAGVPAQVLGEQNHETAGERAGEGGDKTEAATGAPQGQFPALLRGSATREVAAPRPCAPCLQLTRK